MNIAEILKKAAEGVALSEAEKDAAKGFKMPDTEKLTADLNALTARFEASEQRAAQAEAKAAKMARRGSIAALRQKHGIHFVNGVSPAILDAALEGAFEGIDLSDEAQVKETLTSFREANAALILDASGSGAGHPAKSVAAITGKPAGTETADDVAKILAAAKIIK